MFPALLWLGVFFVVPLGMTAAAAFARRGEPLEWTFSTGAWAELGRGGFGVVARDPDDAAAGWRFQNEALAVGWRTFWVSAATTAGALLIGFPAALFMVRRSARWRRVL